MHLKRQQILFSFVFNIMHEIAMYTVKKNINNFRLKRVGDFSLLVGKCFLMCDCWWVCALCVCVCVPVLLWLWFTLHGSEQSWGELTLFVHF